MYVNKTWSAILLITNKINLIGKTQYDAVSSKPIFILYGRITFNLVKTDGVVVVAVLLLQGIKST